ncbi:hypothetical protein HDU76_003871 [Blyttiomyces sp. JEL0837]|nr:hypothetical protein HDU76_003871 [Blyttiomyces sp. JEL0837]
MSHDHDRNEKAPLLALRDDKSSKSSGVNTKYTRNVIAVGLTLTALGLILFGSTSLGRQNSDVRKGSPVPNDPIVTGQGPFNWRPCPADIEEQQPPNSDNLFECGELLVPLDHLHITKDAREISIVMIKLKSSPMVEKKGSVLINVGGPGGRSSQVICYENSLVEMMAEGHLGPQVPGRGMDSIIQYAASQQVRGESCGKWSNYTEFISTAYTARDMDMIREALGEQYLNYYGFSYGTFLGITYVNMFPDHVGRVVLDGNVDPNDFAGSALDLIESSLVDIEALFDKFGEECQFAGPSVCELANITAASTPTKFKFTSTANSISDVLRKTIQHLEKHPHPILDTRIPSVLTNAEANDLLIRGNGTLLSQRASGISSDEPLSCPSPSTFSMTASHFAVRCSDSTGVEKEVSLEEWERRASSIADENPVVGRGWAYSGGLLCKYWPTTAVERYGGPWNRKLSNKVLVIGNTYDPVTPLQSAKNVVKYMEGNSVLLTHDGYGHCSSAQPSTCTINVLHNYFGSGILPEPGTVCKADKRPFSTGSGVLENDEVAKNMEKLQEVLVKEQTKGMGF